MTVYFANHEPLNLDFLRLMGVSVKESNNPIGMFGTGLKYAIAVLLRNGDEVHLRVGNDKYRFHTKIKEIRNQEIEVVYMNDEQLPFSFDLGKNWEPWQAFRELFSNAIDEGGIVTIDPEEAEQYNTVFTIRGRAIINAYQARDQIILNSTPVVKDRSIEAHKPLHPTDTNNFFYRGIRTQRNPRKALFNYNLLAHTLLTEDRTLPSLLLLERYIADLVLLSEDREFIRKMICPPPSYYETKLDFGWNTLEGDPSEAFLDTVKLSLRRPNLNPTAKKIWRDHSPDAPSEYEEFTLNANEEKVLREAVALVERVESGFTLTDFAFVKTLGVSILGKYTPDTGNAYISREAFDQGVIILAGTLYEEWLHMYHSLEDCSRPFQNYILNKLMTTLDRLPMSEILNDEIPY